MALNPVIVREVSIQLYRLSAGNGTHPLQARSLESTSPDPTGAWQKLRSMIGDLGDHGPARCVPVRYQGATSGVALVLGGQTRPVAILPSPIFSDKPLAATLCDGVVDVFPAGTGAVEIPALTYFAPQPQADPDEQRKIQRWGKILNRHAPPGSPWRRQFVALLRSYLIYHQFPLTPHALHSFFSDQLRTVASTLGTAFLAQRGLWHSYHYETCRFLGLLSALLEDNFLAGLEDLEIDVSKLTEGREAIARSKESIHTLAAESIETAMKRLIELPKWLYERGTRRNALLRARQLIADSLGGGRHHKRVAVVGYGLDLDLLDFFLGLGFQVNGVEKKGASQGLLHQYHFGPENPDRLAEAIGFPELALDERTWPQFTYEETREALGYPPRLTLWDAQDPGLPTESCDVVFAPSLVDEAIPTMASLARPGGLLVAEPILYDGAKQATNPTSFCQATSYPFQEELSCILPGRTNLLPASYRGDQRVFYVLRRG